MAIYAHHSTGSFPATRVKPVAAGLSWIERIALFVGIVEIPLQLDKYFAFHEEDALVGALGGINVSLTTVALAVLYLIWGLNASQRQYRTLLRPIFGWPMLLYLAVTAVSMLVASNPMLSLFDLFLLGQAYLLFFFVANRVQTRADILFCLVALAAAIVVQCGVMMIAFALRLDNEAISIGPLLVAVTGGNRHAGTMHSPNLAGSALAVMWFPVASTLLFLQHKWAWRIAFVCTMAGLVAILMTQSRGAILTVFLGCLMLGAGLLCRGWLPKWSVVVVVVSAVLSVYPLTTLYQNRIQHGDAESASSRKHLSLIALSAIAEKPLLGHGSGNCHLGMERFANQADYRGEWFFTVHCKYLLVWVETGILGLVAFLMILGNAFRQGWSVWRAGDAVLAILALSIVAALAGHMVHMAVDIFNSRTIVQLLWCLLGLLAALYKISHPQLFLYESTSNLRKRWLAQMSSSARGNGEGVGMQQGAL